MLESPQEASVWSELMGLLDEPKTDFRAQTTADRV